MTGGQRAALASGLIIVAGILTGVIMTLRPTPTPSSSLSGVVLTHDTDPRKQIPIGGAEITAVVGQVTAAAKSDSSGSFHISVPALVNTEHPMLLRFQRHGYEPLEIHETSEDRICVARMTSVPSNLRTEQEGPVVEIADLRVRYSVKSTNTIDVGSIAQTFEIQSTGDLPCHPPDPCSPDRKWKAAIASVSFDAGKGNVFREPRASCIAGPCPFTKIDSISSLNDGRTLRVVARDWSDTTTFLVEAEITRTQMSDIVRVSYPVIFGNGMDFTLPATAEGPSMQADLNGSAIVFPLGPDLNLSWATCSLKTDADRSKLYRCELKPGYRFREIENANARRPP